MDGGELKLGSEFQVVKCSGAADFTQRAQRTQRGLADGHLAELVLGAPGSRSPLFGEIRSNSVIFAHSKKKIVRATSVPLRAGLRCDGGPIMPGAPCPSQGFPRFHMVSHEFTSLFKKIKKL